MDNSIEILYYESMIDSVVEDRKIMESIIESKYASYLLKENSEELAIYEANMFDSIMSAFSALFEKVVEFIKKLIEKITGRLLLTVDKKLIEQCTEKIKALSREERDKFKLINIDISKSVNDNLEWAEPVEGKLMQYINFVISGVNKFLEASRNDRSHDIPQDQLDKFKDAVANFNTAIDNRSDVEKMKREANSVDFDYIRGALDSYSSSKDSIKNLNTRLNKVRDKMREHQRNMNTLVKINRGNIIRKHNQSQLVKYRDVVQLTTNAMIKLCKFQTNMVVLLFRNEERILRRFLSETPDVEVAQNYKMIEQVDYGYSDDIL